MNYYLNTVLSEKNFEKALELVTSELKKEGFGVLTEIDIQKTLKSKIGVDFKKYAILGACNPGFAYRALQEEDKAGVFLLPCNVVVEEHESGGFEVSIVNPTALTEGMGNKELNAIASEVLEKMERVIDALKD